MKLADTEIYKHLLKIDKDGLIAPVLKSNIENRFVPLLNNIKLRMPEYTSHDEGHSINVLNNMWKILPKKTKKNLSKVEIILLIYSAYLHDVGMLIEDKDLEDIPKSRDFNDFKSNWLNTHNKEYKEIDILKDYVRFNHGHRSELFIEDNKDLFKIKGISYSSVLKKICCGHTLSIQHIKNYNENSRISDNRVNEKYLTIILRIADLIDIYPNRTPDVLYEKIKPRNDYSIQEWQKHLSIIGWKICDTSIEIHAECSEYNTERNLRGFISYINEEIQACIACLGYQKDDYILNLKGDISLDNIKSDGSYIYNDLKFELDSNSIISILMGNKLYSRPEFALRELLQNSVDAVLYRYQLEQATSSDINYCPQISINLGENVLTIEDNGIGMDINIFKNYFMKVGKSYYKSYESFEKVKDYTSVSEFGIGILSTFMLADNITVESKLRPKNLNEATEPIYIDIPTIDNYFIQRQTDKQNFGTKITLKLKDNHPFKDIDIFEFVKECAPLIKNSIEVKVNNKSISIGKNVDSYESLINLTKCKVHHSFSINSTQYGVEGQVFLIKEQEEYVRCESIVAKNGFKVLYSDIFPNWANFRGVINITNPNIKMSANRESFVINDEFKKFNEFIESELIKEIYKYLLDLKNKLTEDDYVHKIYDLISNEVLLDNRYGYKKRTIPEKLRELILLPVIDNSNNEQYKSVKELLLSPQIVTFTRVPHSQAEKFEVPYEEIFAILKKHSLTNIFLVNNSKINSYSTQVVLSSLGLYVNKVFATQIEGFNIFVLSQNISNILYKKYWGRELFGSKIFIKDNKKPLFIPLEPKEFILTYPSKLFNSEHEFIKPYTRVENLKDSYTRGEIEKEFDGFVDNINESFDIYSFVYKGKNGNAEIKKAYLDVLNKSAKKLWSLYKKYDLISPKEKFTNLTEKDFPFGLKVIR